MHFKYSPSKSHYCGKEQAKFSRVVFLNLKQKEIDFFFFWSCHTAYGILVPHPGIEPMPPALEAQSLNHQTSREVPKRDNLSFVHSIILIKNEKGKWILWKATHENINL